jgi:transposase-like protein
MGARDRASVEAVRSSESEMTFSTFTAIFPDNDSCLEYLKAKFYPEGSNCPNCGKATKFHRIKDRSCYSCQYCGHQVYPTAGTIFHKTTTSLQLWFWAIYLMSSTRCGISAKQLEREIGVSYPTAHRMFKQIRSLLSDDEPLGGAGTRVEVDETYVGGKRRGTPRGRPGKGSHKTTVFGMVERGGQVVARVVPDVKLRTLMPEIEAKVLPETMIYSDELSSYNSLEKVGYPHKRVHHTARVYVDGDCHTNTIEGFWALVKNGIRGVYHAVSAEYLQDYLNEYSFRFNRRDRGEPIFWAILDRVRKPGLNGA